MKDKLLGLLTSKTAIVGLLVAILGFVQDQQALITELIGENAMGKVMSAVGFLMIVLRYFTSKPLDEKLIPAKIAESKSVQ